MSNIAVIDRPTTRPTLHLVPDLADEAPAAPASDPALPTGATPRGFALYVGFDEVKAAASGVSLGRIVEELRRTLATIAPDAETYATVALAPAGAGGRDVDVVRRALREPAAVARTSPEPEPEEQGRNVTGVLVDISRKRVIIDGEQAGLTYKEFELLQYLVLREGRTIERNELVSSLWRGQDDEDAPGERTIDVHVRRLRGKLGDFQEIVRTVRGVGYRFDRHADVIIHYGHGTPSPDRF
jgi:DNA-binding winged helix-turn-helix (wHTH) protein